VKVISPVCCERALIRLRFLLFSWMNDLICISDLCFLFNPTPRFPPHPFFPTRTALPYIRTWDGSSFLDNRFSTSFFFWLFTATSSFRLLRVLLVFFYGFNELWFSPSNCVDPPLGWGRAWSTWLASSHVLMFTCCSFFLPLSSPL